MSSCANYIFPSGVRKRIATGGIVAWHGSPSHLHFLDLAGAGTSDPTLRGHNEALSKTEAQFLRAAGVDPFVSWFGKIPPYNVANFYILSVADMGAFGIRNVVAPEGYGPAYLAALPENFRMGVVFLPVDLGQVEAIRPSWLK